MNLSPDETRVLNYITQGYNQTQTAMKLNRTNYQVHQELIRAKKRNECKTLEQLVYKLAISEWGSK